MLLRRYLSLDTQCALAEQCRILMDGAAPGYVPVVRGGGKMHVRMLCLGRHWNGKTYMYESTRSDFDNLPAPPLPEAFLALARELAASWHAVRVGSLHPELLRCRGPYGTPSGQGRERALARG